MLRAKCYAEVVYMIERRKYFWVSIIALVSGAIGACGQAYLLYHDLHDCLPYKIVNFDAHQSMAHTGIWLTPLLAILVGALFVRKRFWLPLVLPVILSPLLFAGVYKAFSVAYGLNEDPNAFGDFTTAKAAQEFYSSCFSLATTGFIIGVILALVLWFVTKPRKLP
jgi:hypothetical protein